MRELPIILVNWKCITYTEHCLASIRDDVHDYNFKAIVIDNHSPDPTCAMGRGLETCRLASSSGSSAQTSEGSILHCRSPLESR
jgi:hypothetical protein